MRIPHTHGRPALTLALQTVVLCARAYGRLAIDSVYNDFRDAEGLTAECEQGRRFGFDGKSLIHPAQIDAANAAFSPPPQDVAQAKRIIAAWEQAQREGKGILSLDGRMIEHLHVEDARRTLETHRRIQALGS